MRNSRELARSTLTSSCDAETSGRPDQPAMRPAQYAGGNASRISRGTAERSQWAISSAASPITSKTMAPVDLHNSVVAASTVQIHPIGTPQSSRRAPVRQIQKAISVEQL